MEYQEVFISKEQNTPGTDLYNSTLKDCLISQNPTPHHLKNAF
jgi:hypothetical protein